MEPVAIVTALALIQYLVIGALVGRARVKGGVQAPAISGDPIFERYFRAHQNTLEQLILFVPSLWIFAHYVSAPVAAGLGLVFIIGRAGVCACLCDGPADTRHRFFDRHGAAHGAVDRQRDRAAGRLAVGAHP